MPGKYKFGTIPYKAKERRFHRHKILLRSESKSSILSIWNILQITPKSQNHKQVYLIFGIPSIFPSKHLAFLSFHIIQHTHAGTVFQIFLTDLRIPLTPQLARRTFFFIGKGIIKQRYKYGMKKYRTQDRPEDTVLYHICNCYLPRNSYKKSIYCSLLPICLLLHQKK